MYVLIVQMITKCSPGAQSSLRQIKALLHFLELFFPIRTLCGSQALEGIERAWKPPSGGRASVVSEGAVLAGKGDKR